MRPIQRGKHPNADLDAILKEKVNREYAYHIPVETKMDDLLDRAIVDEDVRYLIPFLKWCAENITRIDPFRYTLYTTIKAVLAKKTGKYLKDKEIKEMSYSEICKEYFGEEFCSKVKEEDYVPYDFIVPKNRDERLFVLMTNDVLVTERFRRKLRYLSLSRKRKIRLEEGKTFSIEVTPILDEIVIKVPLEVADLEIEDGLYYDFLDPLVQEIISEAIRFAKEIQF